MKRSAIVTGWSPSNAVVMAGHTMFSPLVFAVLLLTFAKEKGNTYR
ncbi:hypothetical protein ACFPGO_04685 [Arcanobacterium canis]